MFCFYVFSSVSLGLIAGVIFQDKFYYRTPASYIFFLAVPANRFGYWMSSRMKPINKDELLLKEYESLVNVVDESIILLEEDSFENWDIVHRNLKRQLYYIDLCRKEK